MTRPDLATGVLLLAHRRLTTLARALRAKAGLTDVAADLSGNRQGVVQREAEQRVRALVDNALRLLQDGDGVPLPDTARLGHRVARAAVTGTMGLGLPTIAGLIERKQRYYRQVVERGSFDPDLSRVVVPSTELVLDIGVRALALATSDDERRKIRGLVLGMLADLATRTVVGPVLRGADLAGGAADRELSTSPAAVIAGGLTAHRLMGGREGADWSTWWLPRADVPAAFFDGYAAALADLEVVRNPPLGFKAGLEGLEVTPLTADHLGRAYDLFRGGSFDVFTAGVPAVGSRLNLGEWFALMIPAFIGPPIALLESAAHDRSKRLWNPSSSPDQPDTTSWLELAALGGLWSSVAPLVYPMCLWKNYPGSSYPFWEAIAFVVVRAIGGIGGLLAGTDEGARKGLLVLQLVPDMVALVQLVVELILGRDHRGAAWVMAMQLLPALGMGLTMLAGAAFRGAGVTWDVGSFLPGWVIVLVICLLLSFLVGAILHSQGGFRMVLLDDRVDSNSLPAADQLGRLPPIGTPEPRGPALVFDDGAIFNIPGLGGGVPDRSHYAYPSGTRTLLKLTWTGSRPLTMTADDARLTFTIGGDAPIVVLAPPGTTALALATRLTAAVVDGATHLTVEQAAVGELQPAVSFPQSFDRATAVSIGNAEHAAFLRHAPRARTAVRFGVDGPLRSDLEGWKVVPSAALGDTDNTAMGAAAELATLLFMSVVPELTTVAPVPPGGPLKPVHEVFRRWNLDERSANEWRQLVAGGARSERFGPDDPTRRAPVGVPGADDPAARALLDRMGWVPLWRAWTRMATDPTQDSSGATAAPYTPSADARVAAAPPTNDALTRAVRLLLNL
jgi:hypothetical protein